MSTIVVKPVSTRREKKQFLELPWTLYRGDPNWIPPLRMDQKELVGYAHNPFYERNRVQTFLAYRDGQPCGRIAAIYNQVHLDRFQDGRGFFGFFESVDDQAVADGLFEAARGWLAQQGLTRLRGPMNPGLNYTLGTLVEGFDTPPSFMMTYNPAYHDRLITCCGLRKAQDLFAFYASKDMLPAADVKQGPMAEQIMERFNVRVRTLDRKRFREDVEGFLDVYNRSMEKHWSFTPMSKDEVQHIAGSLRWLLLPELAVGAEIDGRLVGVTFCLLDYNPRIKLIDGRLFPFGFFRLLWNRRKIKKVRLLAANVLPEYHLMGIGLVLLRALLPQALAYGLEEVEYSWVAESNAASRGSLEKGGAKRIKTYRVYDGNPLQ